MMISLHLACVLRDEPDYSETRLKLVLGLEEKELAIAAGTYTDAFALIEAVNHGMAGALSGGGAALDALGRLVLSASMPFSLKTRFTEGEASQCSALLAFLGFDTARDYAAATRYTADRPPCSMLALQSVSLMEPEKRTALSHASKGFSGGLHVVGLGSEKRFGLRLDYLTDKQKEQFQEWHEIASDGRLVRFQLDETKALSATLSGASLRGSDQVLKRTDGFGPFWTAKLEFRREET